MVLFNVFFGVIGSGDLMWRNNILFLRSKGRSSDYLAISFWGCSEALVVGNFGRV